MSISHCPQGDIPPYNSDDILCHCMSIKRREVIPIVSACNNNLNDLISRSGVGSVCTSCHPLLEEVMGESIWIPVCITMIRQVSSDAKLYRFESNGEMFHPAKSGQHIAVQAYIDGVWEMRRYTLTTAEEESQYREIIVQKESNGKVSNWLHRITEEECLIRVSQPLGVTTPDLIDAKSLVCLVAGAGVTPAISFVRSLHNKRDSVKEIIVDHSVVSKERLILNTELEQLAEQNNKIHLNFRVTDKDGLITQNDINKLLVDYPNCHFYVCGPSAYTDAILAYLSAANIDKSAISIEHFSSPVPKKIKQSKTYFYIGLVLLLAFLVQDIFQLKLAWLESLQAQENYKIYSGIFVVFYMATQFILPYNKSCEKPHALATAYQKHKLRGAFAPLVFFVHSTQLGVAYLFMLSVAYFGNFFIGLFNHERIENPIKRIHYFRFWLLIHIVISIVTIIMAAFHIYVVVSY